MGVDGVGHQASRGRGLSLALVEYWRYVVHELQGGGRSGRSCAANQKQGFTRKVHWHCLVFGMLDSDSIAHPGLSD